MLTATLLISLSLGQLDPLAGTVAGDRIPLAVGELFVPTGLQAADGPIDLLVHLHGSRRIVEQNLATTPGRYVLVTVSLNGLSSVYTRQFRDPEVFQTLVQQAAEAAAEKVGANPLGFRRVTLSSFSAGFGGVRELLKSPDVWQRIDAIVMADSIYAGYAGDPGARRVDPELMAGFLRFAREAAAGRKQLVISHCELQPDGYASTAETADFLLRELGLARQDADESWAEGWRCTTRCQRSGLQVFGFSGAEGVDHLRHLHHIGRLWSVLVR